MLSKFISFLLNTNGNRRDFFFFFCFVQTLTAQTHTEPGRVNNKLIHQQLVCWSFKEPDL